MITKTKQMSKCAFTQQRCICELNRVELMRFSCCCSRMNGTQRECENRFNAYVICAMNCMTTAHTVYSTVSARVCVCVRVCESLVLYVNLFVYKQE